jgi:uncharacterized lipoprotein NlpE involved in copper resistance
MRKTMLALICLTAVLGGCNSADEAANRAFDENFRSSCITAGSGGQLAADLVEKACDCALARINEKYSTADKLTLTNEQAQPIAQQCLQEVMPANG